MNVHAIDSAELPRTRQESARRSETQQAREARERRQVLAELAELMRSNPFLAVED